MLGMLKKILFIIPLLICVLSAQATHNRGGEITWEWLGGTTYKFTIITCTFTGSDADRPELPDFDYGDGSIDTLPRVLEEFYVHPLNVDYNSKKNYYEGTHTYAAPGNYTVCVIDPNRNEGIENINNSVNVVFTLQANLTVGNPFLGSSNSPKFTNCPCPEIACKNRLYCFNLGAYDPDNDSLSYELIAPFGDNCNSLAGNYLPPDAPINTSGAPPYFTGGGGNITIDPVSGTLCWNTPQLEGEFNYTIRVTEWRDGVAIGWVIRDIQLFVEGDCLNDPPVLPPTQDTCITAGENLVFPIDYSDPNGNSVTIDVFGDPFNQNPAPFLTGTTQGSSNGQFQINWNTGCGNVSSFPQSIFVEATDNAGTVQLSSYTSVFVTVNGAPVENLTTTPVGNTIVLNWDPYICSNITGFKIYKRLDSTYVDEACCGQNTAEQLGYSLIGQVNGNTLTFTDDENVAYGVANCYLVTACYGPQTESCISEPSCSFLKFDVPVITHVSVLDTDPATGQDSVIWARPKELDTVNNWTGAFFYRLYRSTGNAFNGANQLIYQTPIGTSLAFTDTMYLDNSGLNTEDGPYAYSVELYGILNGDTLLVGNSSEASSIYLETTPNDNEILLSWSEDVPWQNVSYDVYKETSPGSGVFNFIANTTLQEYTDTGLINGVEYCYKIKGRGDYFSPFIISPLLNWSNEKCDSPIDLTAPCPPTLSGIGDCEEVNNELFWNNPNNDCADDVMSYNIYYSPTDTGSFSLIATINSEFDTVFNHNNNGSVAGCYYVTAVDSVQYSNESIGSNVVCFDNCPYYWLPNIFTPNGDGKNDYFGPFPYRFVERVDCQIFNRWGNLVYETTDPDIRWDGKDMNSGKHCSEGVYMYVVTVYTIRLSGLVPIQLHGNVQLNRNGTFNTN